MQITKEYIRQSFDKYNKLYFKNELVRPLFKITRGKTTLGQFCVHNMYGLPITTISISQYYDRTEKEFDGTIIHEMIHLFIWQNKIADTSSHGRMFKKIAEHINQYGWNIHAYDNTPKKVSEKYLDKENHIITFIDGQDYGWVIKVATNKVKYYYEFCKQHFKDVNYYISTDGNKYKSFRVCRNKLAGRKFINKQEYFDFISSDVTSQNVASVVNRPPIHR
jgi:predicted SprT family Zn-dependent metalloprotease